MNKYVLIILLATALGLLVLQIPPQIRDYLTDKVVHLASLGGLTSQRDYGTMLGEQVNEVVNNIHARVPNSQITHADVLTIMCMESAGRVGDTKPIVSGAGARGVTQVMPDTLAYYARTNKGGFYLPNRPDLLHSDTRFAIEAGALIFNDHLMNYVPKYGELTGRRIAAIAYNGGPGRVGLPKERLPKETRDYAYEKLPNCYNGIKNGISPVNTKVWEAMVARVWQLTRGTMSLTSAPVSSPAYMEVSSVYGREDNGNLVDIWQKWWKYPRPSLSTQPGIAEATDNTYVPYIQPAYSISQRGANWIRGVWRLDPNIVENTSLSCYVTDKGVKLRWSCPTESTITKGYAPSNKRFNTGGANTGAVHAIGAPMGEYKIMCIQGHKVISEATCDVASQKTINNNKAWEIIE